MPPSPHPIRRVAPLLWLAAVGLAATLTAYGQTASIIIEAAIAGENRLALLSRIDTDSVAYVDLNSLVEQFGGSCIVGADRVRVDLAGNTAWLQVSARGVNAAQGRFGLRYPVREQARAALIAVPDIAALFEKGFAVKVRFLSDGTPVQKSTNGRDTLSERVDVQDLAPPRELSPPITQQQEDLLPDAKRALQIVIVDPGHGGNDTGLRGPAGLLEKDLTLAIAKELEQVLKQSPKLEVFLTRTDDSNPTLLQRARFAVGNRGDILISIHAGASFANAAHGFEIFHLGGRTYTNLADPRVLGQRALRVRNYAQQSSDLATAIGQALSENSSAVSRGIREAPCRLLTSTVMPGVLIEVGQLTNTAEESLLATQEYQTKLAQGIALGIAREAGILSEEAPLP